MDKRGLFPFEGKTNANFKTLGRQNLFVKGT